MPLIFWLLAGFFKVNQCQMMKEVGVFRVTGSDSKIQSLELHVSQGNFSYFKEVKEAHTVTNYWKRLLRHMKTPLIPFDFYQRFFEAGNSREDLRWGKIKDLVNELPPIYFNTLKFHCHFFNEVAQMEA